LNKKQYLFIGIGIVIVGSIFMMDTSMLSNNSQVNETETRELVSLQSQQQIAYQILGERAGDVHEDVDSLENLSTPESQLRLALYWDSLFFFNVSAFYYDKIANENPTEESWLKTANTYLAAFRGSKDSLFKNEFASKAIISYNKALDVNPNNLNAQAGIGVCKVENGTNPMEGIQALLAVLEKDPLHEEANKNLGFFSLRTGQFDKAIVRFANLVKGAPIAENYFYLGEAHRNAGQIEEAKRAFKKCMELTSDPLFKEELEGYINNLEKI
jgi:tetratricopeptide (TPR) repeat protein